MEKPSNYWKLVAVAIPALILLGAGCSPTKSLGEQAAKRAIEAASGGKVNVDLNNNGSFKVKGKDGSAVEVGGGSARPDSAPADLPSLPGAKNFSWLGGAGSGMLAYSLDGNEYKKACADQINLLTQAGWVKSDGYEVDVEKMMSKNFAKSGFNLSLTCSDSTDDNSANYKTGIVLTTSKN